MPVADHTTYCEMLDRALKGKFAYPAINVLLHEAVDYGVVKMNIDTDTQYAFSRAIADHFFKYYDGVLKVDGEVGNQKVYEPRTYLAFVETALAERVKQIVKELRATGTTMVK